MYRVNVSCRRVRPARCARWLPLGALAWDGEDAEASQSPCTLGAGASDEELQEPWRLDGPVEGRGMEVLAGGNGRGSMLVRVRSRACAHERT